MVTDYLTCFAVTSAPTVAAIYVIQNRDQDHSILLSSRTSIHGHITTLESLHTSEENSLRKCTLSAAYHMRNVNVSFFKTHYARFTIDQCNMSFILEIQQGHETHIGHITTPYWPA